MKLLFAAALLLFGQLGVAIAAPSPAQLCEAAVELATAKFAQCRLTAESRYAKSLDAAKRLDALAKCSANLAKAHDKATAKYGVDCAVTEPPAEFAAYLAQCSDDVAAAAAGAALPAYASDLAACTGNLATCSGALGSCDASLASCASDLATCSTDLAVAEGDLTVCQADLAACESEPSIQLLQTGQTTCWNVAGSVVPCSGTGSDGESQRGVALAYTDNGDGTITDQNTGLTWEKLDDAGGIHDKDVQYTWSDARAVKIAALNGAAFAGHSDWRLPNRRELESIVNLQYYYPSVSPAFHSACSAGCSAATCSCTVAASYWTSSTYAGLPQDGWVVYFFGAVSTTAKTNPNYVRAVRGGA